MMPKNGENKSNCDQTDTKRADFSLGWRALAEMCLDDDCLTRNDFDRVEERPGARNGHSMKLE
jgi:hypothetical protein